MILITDFKKKAILASFFPAMKREEVKSYYYAQSEPALQLLPIFCGSACPLVLDFKMWGARKKFICFAVKQVLMNHLGNGAASTRQGGTMGETWQLAMACVFTLLSPCPCLSLGIGFISWYYS